jgi:hypothetical protein
MASSRSLRGLPIRQAPALSRLWSMATDCSSIARTQITRSLGPVLVQDLFGAGALHGILGYRIDPLSGGLTAIPSPSFSLRGFVRSFRRRTPSPRQFAARALAPRRLSPPLLQRLSKLVEVPVKPRHILGRPRGRRSLKDRQGLLVGPFRSIVVTSRTA